MVAAAVRRGGRKPKRLPTGDPHFRGGVFELVLNLPVEHVARMRAVAPLRPSGSGRVLHERPADAVDYLLDITDVRIVLRRGSVEGKREAREDRSSLRDQLMRTGADRAGFCPLVSEPPLGSPRAEPRRATKRKFRSPRKAAGVRDQPRSKDGPYLRVVGIDQTTASPYIGNLLIPAQLVSISAPSLLDCQASQLRGPPIRTRASRPGAGAISPSPGSWPAADTPTTGQCCGIT